ncbi:unnamed protein product, partial [Mesorhabditis belari]|uniref:C-type lectin domain-containing protein n=1 Tax=Mesorhabditis belari TaxID=2138241 RepID=A0AAF3E9N0_9BILA
MLLYLGLFALALPLYAKIYVGKVEDTPVCTQGWEEYFESNQCIKAYTSKVDYFEAEIFCGKQGGHLVSVHNGFQNQQVLATAQTVFTQCRYWIGANRFGDFAKKNTRGSRRDSDYPWAWLDKSTFDFQSWKSGFPDSSSTSPDCAFMDVENGARWANNGSCAEQNCFVCQKPQANIGTTPQPVTNWPTPTTRNPWTTAWGRTTQNGWTTQDSWTNTPCPSADPSATSWQPWTSKSPNGPTWWTVAPGKPAPTSALRASVFSTRGISDQSSTRRDDWVTTPYWFGSTYNPCGWMQQKKTRNTWKAANFKLFGLSSNHKSTKN